MSGIWTKQISYRVAVAITVLFVCVAWFGVWHFAMASDAFSDTFGSYSPGTLSGQGTWTGGGNASVTTGGSNCNGTSQCLTVGSGNGNVTYTDAGGGVLIGSQTFNIKLTSIGSYQTLFGVSGPTASPWFGFQMGVTGGSSSGFQFTYNGSHNFASWDNLALNTWHTVTLSWDMTSSCNLTLQVDGGTPEYYFGTLLSDCNSFTGGSAWDGFGIRFWGWGSSSGAATSYIDQFGSAGAPPPPPPDTTHSQFYSFTPALGSTTPVATSTSLSMSVTGFITPADYVSGEILQLQFGINPNLVGAIYAANAIGYTEFNTPLSSAGAFSTTTAVDVRVAGAYPVKWTVTKCSFSIFGICVARSTVITAGGTLLTGLGIGTGEGYTSTSTLQSVRGITSVSVGVSGATTTLDTSNITATSTVFASAYGLAGVILNKFPINWVVQYADVLSSLPSLTATTTIPAVTINYGGLREIQNIPTTTPQSLSFTFFSASTFDTVGQMAGVQLARTLVGYTLWLGLIGFAWRRAKSLFTNAEQ